MQKILFGILSGLSLALCLVMPILYVLGKTSEKNYKLVFLIASMAWFLFATLWATRKKRDKAKVA